MSRFGLNPQVSRRLLYLSWGQVDWGRSNWIKPRPRGDRWWCATPLVWMLTFTVSIYTLVWSTQEGLHHQCFGNFCPELLITVMIRARLWEKVWFYFVIHDLSKIGYSSSDISNQMHQNDHFYISTKLWSKWSMLNRTGGRGENLNLEKNEKELKIIILTFILHLRYYLS